MPNFSRTLADRFVHVRRAHRSGTAAMALLLLAGCGGISLPDLPRSANDTGFQLIANLPGLESVEPVRTRRTVRYQESLESAKWSVDSGPRRAELDLARTSATGRRYFVRSQLGSLEGVMKRRFAGQSVRFDPLDRADHAIGEVEYQRFRLGKSLRCLALRIYDGTPPEEGFQGGVGIHESLGRTVVQGWYCTTSRKGISDLTSRKIRDGIGVRGLASPR